MLALLVVVAAVAFGPVVRGRVAREAARRHLEVEVGAVRPGFFAVTLRDVRVKPEGVAGLEAHLDRVHVDLTAGDIDVDGGTIAIDGEPEDLADRMKAWRARSGGDTKAAEASRGSKKPVRLDNLALAWKLPSGGEVTGSGIRVTRDESGALTAACGKCTARRDHLALEATAADVEMGADGSFKSARAQAIAVVYDPPRAATPAAPATGTSEPAPPPLPAIATKRGAKGSAATAAPAPPEGPVLPLPDLHALRSRIATGAALVAPRLPDGGKIEIDGLSAKVDIGGEPVAFGPAPFTLSRAGDRVHVAFSSSSGESEPGAKGTTPLSIDAEIPLAGGDVDARLAGGPVSLALLGVKEGTKGLTDVTRGTVSGKGRVVLASGGEALTFDGQVALRSISLKQPKIAPEPMRGIDLAVSARGVLDDKGKLRLDDAQVDMGALHAKAHGTIEETPDHFAVSLNLDVAPAACQSLLDSAPQGLLPTVRAARMVGVFGANVSLAFDTRTIDKLVLDYRIDDQCKMHEVPRELSRDHFTGTFTYRTYHPDGSLGETATGPGSASWTALDDISPFMISAVLTTEDAGFYRHHGFNHAAIRSSVAANLKARRFVRGASTISMQLAKNLFLARDKALSRKIEEVILTDYLEQIFRKDDLLELYLNVVEFGPDVYGVTQAAEHYFGRKPEELNVLECYFLASLLPSPIRYGKMWEKGEVSETWTRHLHALMAIGAKNGKISHAELDEGLKQAIVFVKPGDPRPEPRKPVNTTRRDPYEDNDAAWRPLE
ncbi:MAG: transglycosylase domain-containing protein [Labilithrix sp.]|nr:transglycosylase domain-containing protein [Labilithrix sp.]MCW5809863.1 transglycosylase domain-containing protein [Labilithrix sp.]